MTTMAIMLCHGGRWDVSGNFVDYNIDGVIVSLDISYNALVSAIATHLGIDTRMKLIEIKYKVNDRCPPMEIRNDMGVLVYFDMKKDHKELGKYPLCVTSKEMAWEGISLIGNSNSASSDCSMTNNVLTSYAGNTFTGIAESVLQIRMGTCGDLENEVSEIITDATHKNIAEDQVFQDKSTLVSCIKRYAIMNHFQGRVIRSCAKSYSLVCIADHCEWHFKSSSLNGSVMFKVRSFNDKHTCSLMDKAYTKRQATAGVVGGIVMDKFSDPRTNYTPKDIRTDMKRNFGLNLSYMQAWRSKQMALQFMRGDPSESYGKLPSYLHTIKKIYPGSVVSLHKSEDDRFMYTFVALYSSIHGWEFCRPIVVVDGSHLKSLYKGTLLMASTLDAAGNILLLAYAIVDSENDASWTWFFERFREGYGERAQMCVVSDRHESIRKATSRVYPGIPHFACMWHLFTNIEKNFRKFLIQISPLFFAMAKAYTVDDVNQYMQKIEEIDPRVKEFLVDVGYDRWSRVHAPVNRTWTLTSNIAESLNSTLVAARELPVLPLMEYIRTLIERWNRDNGLAARGMFTHLGKKYNKILNKRTRMSHRMTVRSSTDYLHTVIDGVKRFIVCLGEKKCTCGRFQLDEIPCAHALSVLDYKNLEIDDYCSAYLTTKNLKLTYEVPINPLPDESKWDIPLSVTEEVVLAPVVRRPPGRPKKRRDKPMHEGQAKKAKFSCGSCGKPGHNRRTCSNLPKEN